MDKVIGLRIDVDTIAGFRYGTIPLLDILKNHKIRATFCIVTGYDNPLRASRRFLSESGFCRRVFSLRKSLNHREFNFFAPTTRDIVKRIKNEGHELCPHGYHHFQWQNNLKKWSQERVSRELQNTIDAFNLLTGTKAHSFAAPGWVTSRNFFVSEERFHFVYASDTRGKTPFYPLFNKKKINTLQIPVTLPTLDELISLGKPQSLPEITAKTGDIYCAHAEFDGISYRNLFEDFIEKQTSRGFTFTPLSEIKKNIANPSISRISWKRVPGRTNTITCQE